MDEAKGRQVARQMNIRIMGTIGILIESYRDGYKMLNVPLKYCKSPEDTSVTDCIIVF